MKAALATLLLLAAAATAHGEPAHDLLVVTNPRGVSLSLAPKSPNLAPPAVELRLGRRLAPWLTAEVGLALLAYPEHVPELRLGARMHPFAARCPAGVRGLFVRPGAHALLTTSGADVGPGLELGWLHRHQRLLVLAGLGSTLYARNPRLVAEVRLGVGVSF